ncbi:MAG: hypothetical protein U5L95_02190 [Candidatus Saccharibacteria bacterium]|nr:hypothetical protein [Candidatus Saccharibacteria bacterium]
MSAASQQEIQTMLDQMRTRMQDRMATRQDVQRATDDARDRMISYMHDYLQQNQQQFVRQLDDRTKTYKSQITNLEYRIQSLEQEIRNANQILNQMAQKQQSVIIPHVQEAVSNQHNYRYVQEG